MHIPDGFLNTPTIAATYTVSVSGLAIVWQKVKKQFDQRTVPKIAMLAAFIFVAQMINIPVTGGTSGHLLGGFLAALVVGPSAGIFIIALVLVVQMLLFQDGGITALGANILNMGITGVGISYLLFYHLEKINRKFFQSRLFQSFSVFLAAWISVEVSAILCGMELGFSGLADMKVSIGLLAGVHAVIGLLEGIMTLFIYESIRSIRPDMILSFESQVKEAAEK